MDDSIKRLYIRSCAMMCIDNDTNSNVDFVVGWYDPKKWSGSMMEKTVADYFGIPIYNLWEEYAWKLI